MVCMVLVITRVHPMNLVHCRVADKGIIVAVDSAVTRQYTPRQQGSCLHDRGSIPSGRGSCLQDRGSKAVC